MFNRETMGRVAQAEISVYDAMMAEIYAERNKAKSRRVRKPDPRTKAERIADWEDEKERRRWHRFDRDWKLYDRDWKARSECISHAERKIRRTEQVAREDWEIESAEIAESEKLNAEKIQYLRFLCRELVQAEYLLEIADEYDRDEWEESVHYTKIHIDEFDMKPEAEKIIAEIKAMRNLNDWLKYA